MSSSETTEPPNSDQAIGPFDAESLSSQLQLSQEKGREMMERVKESHEKMLRAVADLDNYKKRAQKEREEVLKFGSEKLLKDFLPVIDNIDRALKHAHSPADFESLRQGLTMIRKAFEDTLARNGIKTFKAAGVPFDPNLHEAMQQVSSDQVPANHVVSEVLRGYTLNERLVRPALVVVSNGPPADSEP